MSTTTQPHPPDKLGLTIDDLYRLLPEVAAAIDSARAEGIAHGLAMAWGKDRAEAVCAALRGDPPGDKVLRRIRSRDRLTVEDNLARMRAG